MSSHESRQAHRGWQQAWTDRVHAAGDAAARRHGWTITVTSDRFRFNGRVYRDPRFGARNLAGPSTDQRRAGPGMLTGWTQQRRTNRALATHPGRSKGSGLPSYLRASADPVAAAAVGPTRPRQPELQEIEP